MSKKEIQVSSGYKRNGRIYHTVTVNGEKFENIPNIPKCEECDSTNCKYYRDCMYYGDGVVRTFDCEKNADRVAVLWNLVTGFIIVFMAIKFFRTWNLGFFKGTAALLTFMVSMDVVCCGIERFVDVFRTKHFYRILKKNVEKEKRAEEQKRLAEEAFKMQLQAEEDAKDPNRVKIRSAEITLNQIAKLSNEIDFGESDEKVEFCVVKCKEIIEYLNNNDSSGYIRVENLLQVYLPEFYKILEYYAEFKKADAVGEAQIKKLNETVDYFYNFLCKQKIEAIFDRRATEIKFNASADTLKKAIESRGGKL